MSASRDKNSNSAGQRVLTSSGAPEKEQEAGRQCREALQCGGPGVPRAAGPALLGQQQEQGSLQGSEDDKTTASTDGRPTRSTQRMRRLRRGAARLQSHSDGNGTSCFPNYAHADDGKRRRDAATPRPDAPAYAIGYRDGDGGRGLRGRAAPTGKSWRDAE